MSVSGVKAVLFDVFGTVVDWYGTMLGEINELSRHKGAAVDADQFVNKWRAAYRQGLANIRDGKAPKISNRMVYRASLDTLLCYARGSHLYCLVIDLSISRRSSHSTPGGHLL